MSSIVVEPDQIFAFVGEDIHKEVDDGTNRDALAFTPRGYGPDSLRWDYILMSSLEEMVSELEGR